MHFQIFVPKSGDAWPTLESVGLGDLAAGEQHVDSPGPGGVVGRLFSWPSIAHPQNQFLPGSEWIPAAAAGELPAGRYLVGIRTNSPPTPAELARPQRFLGRDVELGDGRTWHVPAACQLPQRFVLQADGTHALRVRAQFEEFWQQSYGWYQRFIALDPTANAFRTNEDYWGYAYRALSLNYRLLPEVESYLGLIDTGNVFGLILATVEGHTIREVLDDQKKTTDPPSTPGI